MNFFKNPKNRKLGGFWWTRSSTVDSDFRGGSYIACTCEGERGFSASGNREGLVPCFVI